MDLQQNKNDIRHQCLDTTYDLPSTSAPLSTPTDKRDGAFTSWYLVQLYRLPQLYNLLTTNQNCPLFLDCRFATDQCIERTLRKPQANYTAFSGNPRMLQAQDLESIAKKRQDAMT